ncbi:CocE/NonD family hydrolase [Mammaliicoccus sciuri]|uniref:CocE/NonD family hydrolase n=1 Tax=Mammaliicoccus sciuri TaxID=1296 RepID=UPI0021D1E961|nr:CocE/NonD family hydrolase [Mammaliicoccus sciuri]UXU83642.1 CocE/NonD family hydrolase [Mammaliicoccus sciuri]UXU93489.1 CocE/NonD family hydrolase [Mammaliicoccus sciuri]UXV15437.1 CocE/NonD family hydrolase [Mammaliicoccus sciuri]UXV23701.1 CocE/NonD family hydrolase [Mammaliicoccus sciuri]UXV26481.1 CocE/NonD family hydrolase [Mammaliicoccus sciuri]
MTKQMLGNPKLTVTPIEDIKEGINHIVVDSIQYGNQEMIMEKDVAVPMSDGAVLYVNVIRPNKPGKFPVVMSADTYGKDNKPKITNMGSLWPTLGAIPTSSITPEESPDPGFWVPNDYVVVKVALRGSAKSKGALYPWGLSEAKDYAEVIEWAGQQEWSNGNVGTNGVSYLAVTQWWVASLNPSHLKAMIPWEGLNDMYREIAFHGGIPDTGFYRFWYEGIVARWPETEIEDLKKEQKMHTMFDEYWKGKQADLSAIKVPMFVCASWSTQGLHNRGTFEGFKQASSEDKWLKIHGRKEWESYYARESLEQQKEFFDYYLKSIENDWKDTPKVSYEVRDKFYRGNTKTATNFPLPNTKETALYLDGSDMTLKDLKPEASTKVSYNSEVEGKDEVRFNKVFNEDTELTGNMKLKLWVSAEEADDMDLFVGIKKINKQGEEVNFPDFNHIEHGQVASGWLRVSHRELDTEKSTPLQPWHKHDTELKLAKDEIVPIEIEILPSSTLFKKGEQLQVVVKASEVVKGNSTPGLKTRYEHEETVNKGVHNIYAGDKYDSHLLIPVIKINIVE